jgi:hypothetical protein
VEVTSVSSFEEAFTANHCDAGEKDCKHMQRRQSCVLAKHGLRFGEWICFGRYGTQCFFVLLAWVMPPPHGRQHAAQFHTRVMW